jgi:hypothetical protein
MSRRIDRTAGNRWLAVSAPRQGTRDIERTRSVRKTLIARPHLNLINQLIEFHAGTHRAEVTVITPRPAPSA